ncbi:MAG: arginine--tRNA ligase, partial [Terriglobales bacterium]
RRAVLEHLRQRYGFTPPGLAVEVPPKPEMGDLALPVCFELAKAQRRPPRALAQEVTAELALPEGVERVEVAGAGYLNFFVNREAVHKGFWGGRAAFHKGKVIVEHTNINPNKAAHIGHLRNAVLGDTWVHLLRHQGWLVEVQNLQDNTGVQVADVVAAFVYMQAAPGDVAAARERVERALADPGLRFDYQCWDLYAAISQHYEASPEDQARWRPAMLHAIEEGGNAVAELAERIASAMARAHLKTMQRIGIQYDLLPRESEILQLHLWQHAFELLQQRGAIRLESEGKNAGCWVMDKLGVTNAAGEEDSKVLVRSNGTVTYVAKDIAYQLWKFGLLPLEFRYAEFYRYPDGHIAWATSLTPEGRPERFGEAGSAHGIAWVYNVIDTRQSYLQDIVTASLRALGYAEQAGHSIHFSYEMVALSAACAAELGYGDEAEGAAKRVDVSGRKGTGVKADDLIDRLLERAAAEVGQRHPEMDAGAQAEAARRIAVGALRYFLLKFARTTVIAFDFKEALSFEGEAGPYVQYAAVRADNILRKAGPRTPGDVPYQEVAGAWPLLWLAARLDGVVEGALAAQEPAQVAKYTFQLAQAFNNFYHQQPVLKEPDAARRAFLLALVEAVRRQLGSALAVMGMEVPEAM